ncbi:MAG: hypothetical protein AB7U20_00815 [Planctomycetaceae bacterium]
MQNNRSIVRKIRLQDEGRETGVEHMTAEERLGMMWQLAVDAWAFRGQHVDESQFQRHVVRVICGRR